jgi:hypothetical protein
MLGKIVQIMLMIGRSRDGRVEAGQAPADDPCEPITTRPSPPGFAKRIAS